MKIRNNDTILPLITNFMIAYIENSKGKAWRCMPVIPATWEAETGGPWFKASPGKISKTLSQK
jgi:hypothetical protein